MGGLVERNMLQQTWNISTRYPESIDGVPDKSGIHGTRWQKIGEETR